jgi:hypothetical protein
MRRPIHLNKKAQALTELAVFGSILLILLGVLINYGLRYNYQQQIEQAAFSKAMVSAKEANWDYYPSSVQHVVIKDVHIPDPANPFAIGSLTTLMGSAAVTRSYSGNFPTYDIELPQMRIEINDHVYNFTVANFMNVTDVTPIQEKKYLLVFGGSSNMHRTKEENATETEETCWWLIPIGDPIYMHEHCEMNPNARYKISILDYCGGQIINYDSAVARCQMILDESVCNKECVEQGLYDSTECTGICHATIQTPWYCENNKYNMPPFEPYNFVKLNRLFNVDATHTEPTTMGLQQDYREDFRTANVLNKEEGATGITTTDNVTWSSTKTRKFIYRGERDTSGQPISRENYTTVYQNKTMTWTTPK